RLVERDVDVLALALGGLARGQLLAVDADVGTLVDLCADTGALAVHAHPALGDQAVGFAARAEAAVADVLVEAHVGAAVGRPGILRAQVGVFRMFVHPGRGIGAVGPDLQAFGPRMVERRRHEVAGDAAPAQGLGHDGVVDGHHAAGQAVVEVRELALEADHPAIAIGFVGGRGVGRIRHLLLQVSAGRACPDYAGPPYWPSHALRPGGLRPRAARRP